MVGNYLAKCRDSLNSLLLMYAGDRQLPGLSNACMLQNSKGDRKDTPVTLYRSYGERSDPSTRAMIHQLLKVSCWNECKHMRMYVFGLIMTSFLSNRVCRLFILDSNLSVDTDTAVPISPLCRLIWVVTQAFGLHVDLTYYLLLIV